MSNVAIIEPRQKSVLLDMSDRYGMEPVAFEATLRATVVPKDCSREQFAAFLLIAKEYKLNPILKEIYAFPAKGGGIQPIVGVDGWANLINSHPAFDGMDFEDHFNEAGEFVSITCRMYRKDRSHAVTATEYLLECKRSTEPWTKWPRRMLRHKAMVQAARYAFSFAGIVDPDEAERFAGDLAREITSRPSLSERLAVSAPGGDGFSQSHVISEIGGEPSQAIEPNSLESHQPPQTEAQADKPAGLDTPVLPAGDNSESSSAPDIALDGNGGGDGGVSESMASSSPSLPVGWEVLYAAALKKAQKPISLPKYAAQFWEPHGGWLAHKDGPNGKTAVAIFDAFKDNFGDKEQIDAVLRELI